MLGLCKQLLSLTTLQLCCTAGMRSWNCWLLCRSCMRMLRLTPLLRRRLLHPVRLLRLLLLLLPVLRLPLVVLRLGHRPGRLLR